IQTKLRGRIVSPKLRSAVAGNEQHIEYAVVVVVGDCNVHPRAARREPTRGRDVLEASRSGVVVERDTVVGRSDEVNATIVVEVGERDVASGTSAKTHALGDLGEGAVEIVAVDEISFTADEEEI